MLLFTCNFLFTAIAALGFSQTAMPDDPFPEHDTFIIQSVHTGEPRVINVWKPPTYTAGTRSLPVLYMPDGGIQEDFPHMANTLAQLIAEQKIPPMLLVGIENTQRRRDLTGYTEVEKDKEIAPEVGDSGNFRAFMEEELFPEIDRRYSTNGQRSIIGESAAGLFIMETLFLQPAMFSNYIAFDPSLWWNDHYWVRTADEHLAALPATEIRVWFAGSKTRDIAPHTKKLAKILAAANHPGLSWYYSNEPKEKHATIFRATKEKALIWTFGGTQQ